MLPAGRIHRGGFGGVPGLADFLRAEGISRVVDATHPFAAQMSAHAHAACVQLGLPLVRLERPAWVAGPGDRWIDAASLEEAVERIPPGARSLVTTGRKGLQGLIARPDLSGIIRTIEPPDEALPEGWSVLLDRPPHDFTSEHALMERERIGCLLTKNAGGDSASAKTGGGAGAWRPRCHGVPPFQADLRHRCFRVGGLASCITGKAG